MQVAVACYGGVRTALLDREPQQARRILAYGNAAICLLDAIADGISAELLRNF